MKKYNHALFHEKLEKTLTEKEKSILHEAVNIPSLQIGHVNPLRDYKNLHGHTILNSLENHLEKTRAERDEQKQSNAVKKSKQLMNKVKQSYNKGFRNLGGLVRKVRKAFDESIV